MLSKYVWDNIAQGNYLRNVGLRHTDVLSQENRLFEICLVAWFLTGYNITQRSWLFLFNVDSDVDLRLEGQQWIGANIDWNISCLTDRIRKVSDATPAFTVHLICYCNKLIWKINRWKSEDEGNHCFVLIFFAEY